MDGKVNYSKHMGRLTKSGRGSSRGGFYIWREPLFILDKL